MAKGERSRLQIDLTPSHRRLLKVLGERMDCSGDADTTRRLLDLIENISDRIEQGFKVVVVPPEDERPDAVPELTRAMRPESRYMFLVQRPHRWRKQLFFKGRRLTVGQFLHNMSANNQSPEEAAANFDLPVAAAYEAMDYGERYASLIAAEDAEDRRAAQSIERAVTAR